MALARVPHVALYVTYSCTHQRCALVGGSWALVLLAGITHVCVGLVGHAPWYGDDGS
jgi:hypothetical protein